MAGEERELICKVLTYDIRDMRGYCEPKAKIGIERDGNAVVLNLPGGIDFGPSVIVERRPGLFYLASVSMRARYAGWPFFASVVYTHPKIKSRAENFTDRIECV